MAIPRTDPRAAPTGRAARRARQAAPEPLRAVIDVDPTWRTWTGVHGGLLAALAIGEAVDLAPTQPIRAVHALFLAPLRAAAARIESDVLRRGRSTTIVTADVADARSGREAMHLQALLGTAGEGPEHDGSQAPDVPAVGECEPFELPVELVPFARHLEIRPANAARPLAGGDQAELVAWIRLRTPGGLSGTQALTILTDALPPAVYAVVRRPVPIPSADLSIHFGPNADRADAGEWHLVRTAAESAGAGWTVDDSRVWDRHGRLLASARQSRRVLDPPAGATPTAPERGAA